MAGSIMSKRRGDEPVAKLPAHNYHDNKPASSEISARSHGNIMERASHKAHWEDRASKHSAQRGGDQPKYIRNHPAHRNSDAPKL